jgi:putative nucleotidyltransferase with HDIG domain
VADPRPRKSFSLLAQPLDRAAFVAYLLGAVVPLAALAWVVARWVRPERLGEAARWGLLGLLISIAVLSLGAFLVLRQTAQAALGRLDRDNRRLQHLLEASGSLAAAADDDEILRLAASSAAEVAEAAAGFVVGPVRRGGFDVLAAYPAGEVRAARRAAIFAAAESAAETLRPGILAEEGGDPAALAVAVPFHPGNLGGGGLVVAHDTKRPFDDSETQALATLSSLARVALRNAELREAERNFFTHATNLLVATLDRYLEDRSDHSRRVASLANRIGRELELPESRLERLHFAALLHDIGMLRVPRQHVTDLEEVRRHAELGDEMLRPIRIWEDLAPLVRHHHEWFDGSGYPDRLAGEAIPLESRIIGVAEAFDAMTSERSYKPAVSIALALERLEAGSGSQFDPAVIRAMLSLDRQNALG